jgi:starch-binding outer membrane protein, SusD/RagB family
MIMRNKAKLLAVVVGCLFVVSCKKSYLDRTPYNGVPNPTAIQSESDLAVAMSGVYAGMRNTDLFGRTLPVKGDLMADNAYVTTSNSNRYITMNNFTMTSAGGDYGGLVWSAAYIVIKNANNAIREGSALQSTANITQYLGEAYAVRAMMYFELVRNFAHAYTVAQNDPGVPIIPATLAFDQSITTVKPPRNTVKEVYTQVIADLEKAYSMMTIYRGSGYFSKFAARALEARVYQNMGDWANAKTTALDVINNSGWVLLSSTAYVSPTGVLGGTSAASAANTYSPGGYWANPAVQSSSKNETLFEVSSDLLSNNGFDQLGFIYLQVGGGYGDLLGTAELYNLYSATDVRRGLIPLAPAGYRGGQAGNIYLNYKYSNPANGTDKDETKVLRLADIILIAAEAYYNASDYTNANLYLNMVAQKRDPTAAAYANTGAQVLEDILTERRKELAFEGNRLWDLIRLQRSWTKIKNQNPLTTIAVTPANPQLIFPIPQPERDANPNITQNPGY